MTRTLLFCAVVLSACGAPAAPAPPPLPPPTAAPLASAPPTPAATASPLVPAAPCPARSAAPVASTSKPHQILSGRHAEKIVALAFSPDGAELASAANDGSMRVWNVAAHDIVRVVTRVGAYSPLGWSDATHVAYRNIGPYPVLYDVAAGTTSSPFAGVGFAQSLRRAAEATGGAWMSSSGRRVQLFDAASSKIYDFELSTQEKLFDNNDRLAFSADGTTVAAPSAKGAIVVRGTGKADGERAVAIAGAGTIERVGLTPSGDRAVVVSSSDAWTHVTVVATQSGAAAESLPWPASAGLRRADGTSNGGGPPVSDVAATAQIAAAATTSGFFAWDLAKKKLAWSRAVPAELGVPRRSDDFAEKVAFSPDGSTVAFGTRTGRVLIYDAASGRFEGELGDKARSPVDLVFEDAAHLATLARDPSTRRSNVTVWSLAEARLASDKASDPIEAIAATPEGGIATLVATADASCAAGFVRSATGIARAGQKM